MSKDWDILGFGAVAVDDLLYVDQFPQPDSKTPVRERHRAGGGLVGTALVAAARLGARAAYGGVLGDDELSRFTLAELKKEGVDCSPILHRTEARPHYSVIIVDRPTGQRSILAMHDGVTPYPVEHVTEELIRRCRVLFVDHHGVETALHAATLAHKCNIPVVADIERIVNQSTHDLLPLIDHLIISAEFGQRLTGQTTPEAILHHLQHLQTTCCVITDGAHGCWYQEQDKAVQHVPALKIDVVDTTGCGDVFHGAYAACIAQGEPITTAILVATATAGLKATKPGGRMGIPNRATVDGFLQSISRIVE